MKRKSARVFIRRARPANHPAVYADYHRPEPNVIQLREFLAARREAKSKRVESDNYGYACWLAWGAQSLTAGEKRKVSRLYRRPKAERIAA